MFSRSIQYFKGPLGDWCRERFKNYYTRLWATGEQVRGLSVVTPPPDTELVSFRAHQISYELDLLALSQVIFEQPHLMLVSAATFWIPFLSLSLYHMWWMFYFHFLNSTAYTSPKRQGRHWRRRRQPGYKGREQQNMREGLQTQAMERMEFRHVARLN